MSWNGYPSYVRRAFFKKLQMPKVNRAADENKGEKKLVYIKVPYLGEKGEQLLKSLVHKLKRYTKPNLEFVCRFNTKKLNMFCPSKDKISDLQKSDLIYKLTCPGCGEIYIGKTDRCLGIRLNEHGTREDQPMYRHLIDCSDFRDYVSLKNTLSDDTSFDVFLEYVKHAVIYNFSIVEINSTSWSQLEFLEAFYIKRLSPAINKGLKASKE